MTFDKGRQFISRYQEMKALRKMHGFWLRQAFSMDSIRRVNQCLDSIQCFKIDNSISIALLSRINLIYLVLPIPTQIAHSLYNILCLFCHRWQKRKRKLFIVWSAFWSRPHYTPKNFFHFFSLLIIQFYYVQYFKYFFFFVRVLELR